LRSVVERELAFDADFQLAAALFELPGIKPAERRQPQIDTGVGDQVLGLLGWRSDDGDAYVGADTHRDHVFRHLFAGAHAGVETLGDDVGEAVVEEDLDFDVWILP
jgi:hypothetical protein